MGEDVADVRTHTHTHTHTQTHMCTHAHSCDAHHMTDPRADGLGVSTCIEAAIRDARIDREQVNYINAHATR